VRPRTLFTAFLGVLGAGALSGVAAAGPLAPLPGTAPPAAETARPPVAVSAAERLSRGVVTIERDGRIIAVGTILGAEDGAGRILTALSPLGTSELADVRYADGSVVHAKIGHKDRAWDLALLVPLTGRWLDCLIASGTSPADAPLQAPVALHAGRPALIPAHLRGTIDAHSKDGDVLASVLDVELQGATPTLGAPLLDGTGGVLGVFVKACQPTLLMVPSSSGSAPHGAPTAPPAPPCTPLVVAAPIAAIGAFLQHTPASAVTPSPWLGIVGVTDTQSNPHGVRVMAVAPDGPAQKAGLKASEDHTLCDLIVGVDGQPIESYEALAEAISHHAIGERVKLLLVRGGKFHEATVVLRTAP